MEFITQLIRYGAEDIKLTGSYTHQNKFRDLIKEKEKYDQLYENPTKTAIIFEHCAIALWFYLLVHGFPMPPPIGGPYRKKKV